MTAVFDPQVLHSVANEAIGRPIDQIIAHLTQELERRYPGAIEPNPQWVLNNAGGAMGSMLVLHASITEYLIVFGSPIGTEGHTGRFMADDWFIILDGEQWAFEAGSLEREVYRPGDMHRLVRGSAKGYRIPERCWALEYARGWIPAMLPFGMADTVFSTLDVRTLSRTFSIYGRAAFRHALRAGLAAIQGGRNGARLDAGAARSEVVVTPAESPLRDHREPPAARRSRA